MRNVSLIASLLILGGCGVSESHLGTPPTGPISTVAAARALAPSDSVTLSGRMVEKCPVAGCWFILRDPTGVIKVGTKSAGFVVVDVPMQTTVTVSGRIVPSGAEAVLEAKGLSY